MSAAEMFFLLSMERTNSRVAEWGSRDPRACCVWWMPNANGYTTAIAEAGRFTREQAIAHSDPPHHLAVPCAVVDVPAARAKSFAKKAIKESRFDRPKPPELSPPFVPFDPTIAPAHADEWCAICAHNGSKRQAGHPLPHVAPPVTADDVVRAAEKRYREVGGAK